MTMNFGFLYQFFLVTLLLSQFSVALELSGTVSSSQSLQAVKIRVTEKSTGTVTTTVSNGGAYSLEIPEGNYQLEGVPSDSFSLSTWTLPSFFSISSDLNIVKNQTFDFEFEPCFTIVALAFDSDGNAIKFNDFSSFAWTTDLNQVTARSSIVEIFSEDPQNSTLGFSLPLNEKRILMAQFSLPNVGNLVMKASNGSFGFSGSSNQKGEIINLNYEFARDSFNSVSEKKTSSIYQSLEISPSFDSISQSMNNASDSSSQSSKALIANKIISDCYVAEENLEMKRAERDIQQFRKSNLNVQVSDEKGNAMEGITVRVEQQSHDFRFGLYGGQIPEGQEKFWKLMNSAGINSATVDFWWISTEPTENSVDYKYVMGQKIDFLKSLGLKLRATGLFQPDPNEIPSYALNMNFDDFSKSLYKHTFNLVSTFCKDFELIEVSTDLNVLANKMGYNSSQTLQLQQIALNAIKLGAPNAKTSVSMNSDYFAQSKYDSFKGPQNTWDKTTLSPFYFSKMWIEAGQNIDQIGQQIYNGGNRIGDDNTNRYDPSFSVSTLSNILDKLSSFGKPIRISEVAVPGMWGGTWEDSEAGYVGNHWSEDTQADFVTKFYTMAFSKKMNQEITWWGLFDDAYAYPGGTFLDSNGTPKKSYQNLFNLVKGWSTDAKIATDSNGKGTISAFGGSYKVSAFKSGSMIGMSEMRFPEGTEIPLVVKINSKGIATFSQVAQDFVEASVVKPVAPVPVPSNEEKVVNPNNNSSKGIPKWSYPLIILGGFALVSAFTILIAFIVARRKITKENAKGSETPEAKESKDGGLAAQDTIKYDPEDLEAGSDLDRRESIDAVPATWVGQPLSSVPLESGSEDENDMESERETETEGEMEAKREMDEVASEYGDAASEEERESDVNVQESDESECDEALDEEAHDEESSSEEEKL